MGNPVERTWSTHPANIRTHWPEIAFLSATRISSGFVESCTTDDEHPQGAGSENEHTPTLFIKKENQLRHPHIKKTRPSREKEIFLT